VDRRCGADPGQLRAQEKNDGRYADHILKLLVEGRFPRFWAPDREQRDLRQLVRIATSWC